MKALIVDRVRGQSGFDDIGNYSRGGRWVFRSEESMWEVGVQGVGYSHMPCSFPHVFVDSPLVLCGHLVRVAIHSLVT